MTADAERLAARIRSQAATSSRPGQLKALEGIADEVESLVVERDAYKRAKAENDDRFMIERDEARAERDAEKERADSLLDDHAELVLRLGALSAERDALRARIVAAIRVGTGQDETVDRREAMLDILIDESLEDEDEDEDAPQLEACDSCDSPLIGCERDAACCDDCTHGPNRAALAGGQPEEEARHEG